MDDQPARTSAPCLEELQQECERMGLPPDLLRNARFRSTLITFLILDPLAKSFAEVWRDFSDEQICEMYSGFLRGSGDVGFVVKFPSSLLSSPDSQPAPLLLALVLSMGHEFERRVLRVETPAGTLLRKWAASGTLSPKELARLQAAQPWRRYNPEGKEENSSCFILALMEKLAATAVPSVLSKEGLLKFRSGWLNDLPAEADNVVRAEVEKVRRRTHNTESLSKDLDLPDTRVEFAAEERRILLAEIRAVTTFTANEKQVIELYLQDLGQEEIASRLDLSQARVSQLQSSAIKKMRERTGLI